MKLRTLLFSLFFVLVALPIKAEEPDYLGMLAQESEIKAIATIANVNKMTYNSDGTFTLVTFKRIYAVTPYTPKQFVGACKILDAKWQKRIKDHIYYKPRRGQKVYVTVSTDGGAITSMTPMDAELDHVVRNEPYRIEYRHGRAVIAQDNF